METAVYLLSTGRETGPTIRKAGTKSGFENTSQSIVVNCSACREEQNQSQSTTSNRTVNSLSNNVIQKLVTLQITLQSSDIQTEQIIQPINSCDLDREADLIVLIRFITIDGFNEWLRRAFTRHLVRRRSKINRVFVEGKRWGSSKVGWCRCLGGTAAHDIFEYVAGSSKRAGRWDW